MPHYLQRDIKIFRQPNIQPEIVDSRQHPSVYEPRSKYERELYWLLGAGVAWILLFSVSGTLAKFAHTASIAFALAGAAFFGGILLGFVFGIPRTHHSGSEREGGEQSGRSESPVLQIQYRANTNLEQISDWLTKILVGIGLTQVGKISQGLTNLGNWLVPVFGRQEEGKAFGLGIVLYFAICGFLAGLSGPGSTSWKLWSMLITSGLKPDYSKARW